VAALAATPFFYNKALFRVEEELRSRVEATIAERFPQLKVRVAAAHLTVDGIEVRGLSLAEPDAQGPQGEILFFDDLFFACRTSMQELLSGNPVITSIKVGRPVLHATRRADGSFSVAKLFPLPEFQKVVPTTTIENATIVVFDPIKNPSSTFTLREINLTIKPSEAAGASHNLLDVQGYLTGDQIQRVEVSGTVDRATHACTLSGTIEGMAISPEMHASLPEPVSEPLEVLRGLRAQANLTFRVTGDGSQRVPHFEVNGSLAHGHLDDPLLPYPLTDLRAEIHCDNAGFRLRNLTALQGQATWELTHLDRRGFDSDSPLELHVRGKQVHLDAGWGNLLPEPWRTDWKNFDPEGDVDLDCTLVFDGQRWKPTLEAKGLNNVSFCCHKFPYRLERARGTLSLRDNVLDVAMVAQSGAQPVTLNGRFLNPGPQFTGWIDIQGDKIQFDEKLFAALLKPKSRETLRSLNPHGTFNFLARLRRDDPRIHEMRQTLRIALNGVSLNYDKFRYELNNLQGTLDMHDGQWSFPKLVGTHGTGVVTLSGSLSTSPTQDILRVSILGKNIPLQEELRNALPHASQQQLWDSLQPHGKIDIDKAEVTYDSRTRKISVDLRAFPRDDATSIGTSIEPVAFPYRMRLLDGSIHYREGHVELENIHAAHRNTVMHTGGSCDISPDGSWELRLRDMTVDRIRLHGEDHELEAALPAALKRAVAELRPKSPINLTGAVNLAKAGPAAPLRTSWNVNLFLHEATLQVGPALDNIFGRVQLVGSSEGSRFASRGELDLNSLTYKNFQFTQIIGPLWFDNNTVVLGDWGPQSRQGGQANRHVTANVLGGILTGDCNVQLGSLPHYHLIATISQADLAQFARENMTSHQRLDGKILANIDLHGRRRADSLFGSGNIHLNEANIYELPVMVSLLKIIRAKPPDTTAFTECDVAFDIRGEHILLKRINLIGDAINLMGQGALKLDGQTNPINLQLHTMVGRGTMPLVTGLLSEASQQIMSIEVTGTIDHPVTRTQAFPAANQALQQLQADNERPTPLPPADGVMQARGPRR
jgi:hypothetical protein